MDLRDQLQTTLGDTYSLEREFGGGGMSRVFLAHEHALDRDVVIKVLTPDLAAGISAERFAREIKLAASLQQANIVPLLSAGTAAGLPYYTMPVVEGRSLHERLAREGALPVAEAVSILRDVARALAYAHARGVVHRDIKPANVLLSGGTAVVTDFGIAKALGAARAASGDETITQAGTSLGTPAYMAPEQAAGDPATDHRADLYAFGCMAYEMFTGKPPFHGASLHEIVTAHFTETPRPVTEQRADVPPAAAELIARCLEKNPARRPQSASELFDALDGAVAQSIGRSPPVARRMVLAGIALAIVAVVSAAYLVRRAPPEPLTLTVVPFRNLTHDTALEYRSDGIGDEILTGMAKVPGVQILGRSAAYRYKDQSGEGVLDVRTVERELGVRLLVTGTLRESEGSVTISAQLNDSMARGELWAGTFIRDSKNFASITDDIVRTVADTLRAHFGSRVGEQPVGAATTGTASSEALDLYLVGQALLKRRGSGVPQSVAAFERAIALDPKFARAYAGLATALQLIPFFVGSPPDEVKDRTINAAQRALELDSTLADAHVALGSVYFYAAQWRASDAELQRALALEPNNVAARLTYARCLMLRGETAEAIDQLQRARKLERVSPLISAWLAYGFFLRGRPDSALAESDRAIQLDSTLLPATNLGALLNLALGRTDVARRLVAGAPSAVGVMTNAPYVYAKLGDTMTANRMLHAMKSNTPRPWFTDVSRATVLLATGDSAGALSALERSARTTGPLWIVFIPLGDPTFDPVRMSARFAALLRQANVDVPLLTAPRAGRKSIAATASTPGFAHSSTARPPPRPHSPHV